MMHAFQLVERSKAGSLVPDKKRRIGGVDVPIRQHGSAIYLGMVVVVCML